jgi:hypothetical protein
MTSAGARLPRRRHTRTTPDLLAAGRRKKKMPIYINRISRTLAHYWFFLGVRGAKNSVSRFSITCVPEDVLLLRIFNTFIVGTRVSDAKKDVFALVE